MSLFKTRDLWSTQCGGEETFDSTSLVTAKINGTLDKIFVGSHSGVLRVLQPTTECSDANIKVEYKPTDLLIETQLSAPILQLAVGKLVSGSQAFHLCVLHPRSVAVYSLVTKTGAAKHGDQSSIVLVYEHQLHRSSFSMVIGPFGGSQGRDFICVQTLDGTLAFYEQETFAFNRFLPSFLLPGPIGFVAHSDSFVTVSSSWHVDSYRYQLLAEAKDSSDDNSETGKRISADWSFSLGEPAIDLKIIVLSNETTLIFILGERNLFCFLSNGTLRYMKRLEYKPHCFHPYVTEKDGRLMTLVASDANTLLVYELATLRWSSQLDLTPVAITVGNFDVTGLLVLLSETGQLQCCYLGTEPSLFVAPPLETHPIDYKAAAKELEELQKLIKSFSKTNSQLLANAASDRELSVNVLVSPQLEPCAFKVGTDDPSRGTPAPMCQVVVELLPHSPLNKVQVSIIVQYPLAVSQISHTITSLCAATQVSSFAYVVDDSCDVSTLDVQVVTSYVTGVGIPRVIHSSTRLPLPLVARYAPPDKDADFKLTIVINKPAVTLAQLFPDYVDDGALTSTSVSAGFCCLRKRECAVSILSAKSSHRYRLQSNSLPSLCLYTEELVSRLRKHFVKDKDFACSYASSLPVHELFAYVEEHFLLRERSRKIQKDLECRATQFRAIQRRLLTKFKDKTPRPLANLDTLLKDTHNEIMAFARELEQNQLSISRSGCQLGCVMRLVLTLIKLMNFVSEREFKHLSSALSSSMHDVDEQGWEEVTEAAVSHLLRTVFAKNTSEQQSSKPITLDLIKDVSRLKKHISAVIDRLSKSSYTKKLKDDGTIPSGNIPSIPEGSEMGDEGWDGEDTVPVGSRFGERLLTGKTRGTSGVERTADKEVAEDGASDESLLGAASASPVATPEDTDMW